MRLPLREVKRDKVWVDRKAISANQPLLLLLLLLLLPKRKRKNIRGKKLKVESIRVKEEIEEA